MYDDTLVMVLAGGVGERLYPLTKERAKPEILSRNVLGQPGLWAFGVSGDLPILLVRVVDGDDLPLVRQVLRIRSRDIFRHGVVSGGGSEPPFWLSGQAGDNATSDSHQSWDGTIAQVFKPLPHGVCYRVYGVVRSAAVYLCDLAERESCELGIDVERVVGSDAAQMHSGGEKCDRTFLRGMEGVRG